MPTDQTVKPTDHGVALVVDDVRKVYQVRGGRGRTTTAVAGVSFTIAPGAAVGLVGASGSGKSTLAKMITATEKPTDGTVTFGDRSVSSLRGGANASCTATSR